MAENSYFFSLGKSTKGLHTTSNGFFSIVTEVNGKYLMLLRGEEKKETLFFIVLKHPLCLRRETSSTYGIKNRRCRCPFPIGLIAKLSMSSLGTGFVIKHLFQSQFFFASEIQTELKTRGSDWREWFGSDSKV